MASGLSSSTLQQEDQGARVNIGNRDHGREVFTLVGNEDGELGHLSSHSVIVFTTPQAPRQAT